MSARRMIGVLGFVIVSVATAVAQLPTPTPALDRRGKPLPFGVQPYSHAGRSSGERALQGDDVAGTGPAGTSGVNFPADLSKLAAKETADRDLGQRLVHMPGNRFRQYLTEIASHGYLVIAGGPRSGQGSSRSVRGRTLPDDRAAAARGRPQPAAPPAPDPANPPGRVTVPMLKHGIEWAIAQNADPASQFRDKIDTQHIVAMGQSCGGGLAVQLAVEDPRVNALGVWNSGARARREEAAAIPFRSRESKDLSWSSAAAKSSTSRSGSGKRCVRTDQPCARVPTDGETTSSTSAHAARRTAASWVGIAWNWLEWTTRGDQVAAKMFRGAGCSLCKDPAWHVMKRRSTVSRDARAPQRASSKTKTPLPVVWVSKSL